MKKQIDYQKVARTIVRKEAENIVKTINKGYTPDLHWKLEIAIINALRDVVSITEENIKQEIFDIIKEFDKNGGTTNN